MQWGCPQGHTWESTYNYLASHPYCPTCREKREGGKSLERCRRIARQRGGECLSESFVSVPGKMGWRCKNGHEWLATHTQIKAGHWCPECKWQKRRLGIGRMREIATERGGACLSERYHNQTEPLRWRCSQGHEWEASYASIRLNSWCPSCAAANRTGFSTAKIADMRELAAGRGGWCLSYRYRNNKDPLRWECGEGHRWTMAYQKARAEAWCPQCKANRKRQVKALAEADRLAAMEGYLAAAEYLAQARHGHCLSTAYHGYAEHLKLECAAGHRWPCSYHNLRKGRW